MTLQKQQAMVLSHFQVAFFDKHGCQVPSIQKYNLLALLADHAQECGYDMDGMTVVTFGGNFLVTWLQEENKWRIEKQ